MAANNLSSTIFCDTSGREVEAIMCPIRNELTIPVSFLNEIGIILIEKSKRKELHISTADFTQEYLLMLLSASEQYMLRLKTVFEPKKVLDTIEECKRLLLQNYSSIEKEDKLTPTQEMPAPAVRVESQSRSRRESNASEHQTTWPTKESLNTSYNNSRTSRQTYTNSRSPRQSFSESEHTRNFTRSRNSINGNGGFHSQADRTHSQSDRPSNKGQRYSNVHNADNKPFSANGERMDNRSQASDREDLAMEYTFYKGKNLDINKQYESKEASDPYKPRAPLVESPPSRTPSQSTYNGKENFGNSRSINNAKRDSIQATSSYSNIKPLLPKIITTEPCLPSISLQNNAVIKLEGYDGTGRLLLRTRQDYDQLQRIKEYIRVNDERFGNCEPVMGQIVVVQRASTRDWSRAVVTHIHAKSSTVNVRFLDYSENQCDISWNQFKVADEALAEMERAVHETSVLCVGGFKEDDKDVINHSRGIKFTVKITGSDFDLVNEQCDSFVSMLPSLKSSQKETRRSKDSKPNIYSLKDLEKLNIKPGVHPCIVVVHDIENIYFTPSSAPLESVILQDIEDDKPHAPIADEIVMAQFVDLSWYRAIVKCESKGKFYCHLIDFGNFITIEPHQIRKFSAAMAKFPICGLLGRFIGVDKNQIGQLKATISEDEAYDVEVLDFENGKYNIKIQSVYDQLK